MTSTGRHRWTGLPVLVTGFSAAWLLSAHAQTAATNPTANLPPDPWADARVAETTGAPVNTNDDMKDIDVDRLDWSQLNVDASAPAVHPAGKARSAPQALPGAALSWSSNDNNTNGSSAVSVKQSLSSFLNTQVGADMSVARQPQTLTESQLLSELLANGGSLPQSSGTAWASITAPGVDAIWDKTAVEARVDPSQDQSKLGTSLSKSVPLTDRYSLTLQNGYDFIEQGAIPGVGMIGHTARSYDTDQSATLNIADTGTSFTAGQSLSSTDERWLRRIGAEQKLFGGVSISGSIGENPVGPPNRSLTAGYRQSW